MTVPWPREFADRYRAEGYWSGRTLTELLDERAASAPAAPALVDGPVRLTHAELVARSRAGARRLTALGLGGGDTVLVQLPNGWEFVVLTLACLRLGVVPVMALPGHRTHELTHLARLSGARAIAVPDRLRGHDHQEMAHQLAAAVPGLDHVLVAGADVRAESGDLRAVLADGPPGRELPGPGSGDPAVFLLSGGTTGLPKLIARTHDDYAYNALASADVAGLCAESAYLVSLPAGHNFPLACPGLLGTLLVGGRVVLLASPDPERAFAAIAAEAVTHTAVVPAVAQRWLDQAVKSGAGQLGPLQVLQVGGARLADQVAARVRPELGVTLQQVFGMAEGLLNYTRLDDPDEVVCTTQGRPLSPADEVRIVDELDRELPAGVAGALLTRGPYTPRGYYRAPEQNARAFTGDGWYRSGDVVRRRTDGNLVVEGRNKDMINRGGEKVSAEDVENISYLLSQVAQAAAVAMPDPELGERVCLYVVPRPGERLDLGQVRTAFDQAGVARFAWPERLELVQELPATKVGKIDKAALRADIADRLRVTRP